MGEEPPRQIRSGLHEMNGMAAGAQALDNRLNGPQTVEFGIRVDREAIPPRLLDIGCGGQAARRSLDVIG